MARIKYYYDTEKCRYERVKVRFSEVILNILGFLSLAFLMALGLVLIYNKFFPSLAEYALKIENEGLRKDEQLLQAKLEKLDQQVDQLQERDASIYRIITGADSLPEFMRQPRAHQFEKYQQLASQTENFEQLLLDKRGHVDRLFKRVKYQNESYQEIMKLADNKEKMLACIPAIQPISNKELKRLASGYGWRTHPIYKVKKFHWGVDFSAPTGTPIYATGDGVVKLKRSSYGGYGKQVEIDHGFGFVTKYAHMNDIHVNVGQKVKRGEQIGEVGSTGSSTSPHLHYEVIRNKKKVNPVHYFFNDLNAEEYEEILRLASIENQSLS